MAFRALDEKRCTILRNRLDAGRLAVEPGLDLAALEAEFRGDHHLVAERAADGRLLRVLGDWCAPFSGYHLYYPSRRQPASAFAVLVEALRYRK